MTLDTKTEKTAIVTGGGAGIGEAICKRFAENGHHVVIVDRDANKAESLAENLQSSGYKARSLCIDISDTEAVNQAFAGLERIDILVNNAGVSSIGNLEATEPDEMDRIYHVNVKGAYLCLRAAVPKMRQQGSGAILNLASIVARLGVADRFAYSMSKGAMLSMTLSVARDYVQYGIRCNCICPARTHTPFVDAYLEQHYADSKQEMFEKLSSYQPIGRMAKPEEIAALAAFLCSDDAAFITGVAYDIDGGTMTLR